MTAIYLASRFSRREEMRGYAAELRSLGHDITSRWIESEHAWPDGGPAEQARRRATDDVRDLLDADLVISFSERARATRSRGGRHVELGMAFVAGKRCLVVGHREHVFHHLPSIEFHDSWESALEQLRTEVSEYSRRCRVAAAPVRTGWSLAPAGSNQIVLLDDHGATAGSPAAAPARPAARP